MDSTHRSFGWIHAVLALAVAIQFVASWFYDQDVSNDVWAILNYFMAIGVIAAVAFSYERWRGTDASDAGARRSSTAMLIASVVLVPLYFEQWRFSWTFFQAGGEVLPGFRLLLWEVVDTLFILVNAAVGRYLLRGSRAGQ